MVWTLLRGALEMTGSYRFYCSQMLRC